MTWNSYEMVGLSVLDCPLPWVSPLVRPTLGILEMLGLSWLLAICSTAAYRATTVCSGMEGTVMNKSMHSPCPLEAYSLVLEAVKK